MTKKASRLQEEGAGRGTLTLHQRCDGKAGTGEWSNDVQRCRDVHWCPARGGVHFMLGLKKTWAKSWKQKAPTKTQTEKQIQKAKARKKNRATEQPEDRGPRRKIGDTQRWKKEGAPRMLGHRRVTEEEAEGWCNN